MKVFNIIAIMHVGSVIQIRFEGDEKDAHKVHLIYQMAKKDQILMSSVLSVRSEEIHGKPSYDFEAFKNGTYISVVQYNNGGEVDKLYID